MGITGPDGPVVPQSVQTIESVFVILAQLSIYPVSEGLSMGRFVRKGVKIIEESGYTYQVGGMSTSIEVPTLPDLFELVNKIHQAQLEEGARRLIIELKVDDRRDKDASLAGKIQSVTDKVGE
ncbi:MAG: MTH1187 family thiamine-binding protein [Desulfobulbaceae bacterium]|nr:MTH1187 family thiamine-binding protein [Desulfobulbaceae bacterium]